MNNESIKVTINDTNNNINDDQISKEESNKKSNKSNRTNFGKVKFSYFHYQ